MYTVTEDGERDRCVKFSQLKAMNSTGNLLKAGFWTLSWRRVNGVASPAGPADKVASGREPGVGKTETGSARICITKRAINKVLRCRGHRQKSVSSFQARSCNLPLPPVRSPSHPLHCHPHGRGSPCPATRANQSQRGSIYIERWRPSRSRARG